MFYTTAYQALHSYFEEVLSVIATLKKKHSSKPIKNWYHCFDEENVRSLKTEKKTTLETVLCSTKNYRLCFFLEDTPSKGKVNTCSKSWMKLNICLPC